MKCLYILFFLLIFHSFYGLCIENSSFQKGVEELAKENYVYAQEIFKKEIINTPTFSSFYNLGIASGELNDWFQAKWAFERALKIRPLNNDAQFNAQFATSKINVNEEWNHPFSWTERIIINFNEINWLILGVLTSILSSVFIYFIIVKKTKQNNIKKWSKRLIIPSTLLFGIACYGLYTYYQLQFKNHFIIPKNSDISFFVSPNGIKTNETYSSHSRFKVVETETSKSWIKIQTINNNQLWVNKDDVYTY